MECRECGSTDIERRRNPDNWTVTPSFQIKYKQVMTEFIYCHECNTCVEVPLKKSSSKKGKNKALTQIIDFSEWDYLLVDKINHPTGKTGITNVHIHLSLDGWITYFGTVFGYDVVQEFLEGEAYGKKYLAEWKQDKRTKHMKLCFNYPAIED